MRTSLLLVGLAAVCASRATAQTPDFSTALRWRTIGPFRAGRARALAATPGHPTVFYIGFDNGGLWRSSDYGSNWEPLFDHESTGSIGAIAVAPSAPNVIYVGSGAGIIRPDLATGNGMYRSNDTGRTWTHLGGGLDETQMIAYVDVDPANPDRLFVAATAANVLGGGILRSRLDVARCGRDLQIHRRRHDVDAAHGRPASGARGEHRDRAE